MTLTRTPAPPAAPYLVQLCIACHEPWADHLDLVRDSLRTDNELTTVQLADAVDHSVCVTLLQLKHLGPPGPPGPAGPMGSPGVDFNKFDWRVGQTAVMMDEQIVHNPGVHDLYSKLYDQPDDTLDDTLLTAITKGTAA